MKNKNKLFSVIITICLIIQLGLSAFADSLKDISAQADKYVDMTSISSDYKVHNAASGDGILQITFLNKKTRQRMSITFSKYMVAKNKKEMTEFIDNLRKNNGTGSNNEGFSSKITSYKTFYAQVQSIPYFNVNQYDHKKLFAKAMIGAINNYNEKFILIQSYSSPRDYDEQEAIKFFSNIKLKTDAF